MAERTTAEHPPSPEAAPIRWPLYLGTAVLGLILIAAGVWALRPGAGRPASARVGYQAPEISLRQLKSGQVGERVALSSFQGHPVVVNFWATWCDPCRAEFPAIEAKYGEYKNSKQLIVIGIDAESDAGPDAAQKFVDSTGSTFPIWLDADGSAEQAYRVDALPTTVFIDRQGIIQDLIVGGPLTKESLEKELEKIF